VRGDAEGPQLGAGPDPPRPRRPEPQGRRHQDDEGGQRQQAPAQPGLTAAERQGLLNDALKIDKVE
jgi:hypothetical protein